MKQLLFLILSLSAGLALSAQSDIIPTDSMSHNKIVFDTLNGNEILTGICDKGTLMNFKEFGEIFHAEFNDYSPNVDDLAALNDSLSIIKIKIVLGTWCSDSQREVPRFLKLMELLGLPEDRIEIIGVDRKKEAEVAGIKALNIKLVPTFIIYREGIEIGRIIESPIVSLEADLLKIIRGK
jgi:thiol-disulfide isomerase/thioredoxin